MAQHRTDFDKTFCGKLPLHQTNLIQPHGLLLVVSTDDFQILQASENCQRLLDMPAQEVVRHRLDKFVAASDIRIIQERMQASGGGKLPLSIRFGEGDHSESSMVILHRKESYFVLEIDLPEYIRKEPGSFTQVFQEIKGLIAIIERAETVDEVCRTAAKAIKDLSGFDKVMLYSFDEDWNGSVLAEEKEPGMDSYLGLKFPASDIPKPARDMYFKNPYRLIPNRDYAPVKLYPLLNPVTHTFSNLADSDLRSVAGVHLEYLKNMGVSASMSTRIIYEGRLWGLIACHHRTAKYLSFEECSVFELLSNVLSARITVLINGVKYKRREGLTVQFGQFVERMHRYPSLPAAILNNREQILQLLSADGAAICWNGDIEVFGQTPPLDEVEALCYWLQGKSVTGLYHQPSLTTDFEEAEGYAAVASGLLALPVQSDLGHFLLGFRKEAVHTVSWGGNPDEALTFEKDSPAYHPRNSFSQWQETVSRTAIPWTEVEQGAAEQLRNFLVEYTLNSLQQ